MGRGARQRGCLVLMSCGQGARLFRALPESPLLFHLFIHDRGGSWSLMAAGASRGTRACLRRECPAKPRRHACMMLRGGRAVPSLLIRHTVTPRLRASMSRLSSFVQACDCVLGDCSACSCEPARALHLCGVALSRVGVARCPTRPALCALYPCMSGE